MSKYIKLRGKIEFSDPELYMLKTILSNNPEIREAINNNNFEEAFYLFFEANDHFLPSFTKLLIACDIDFLDKISTINIRAFHHMAELDSIHIPGNIEEIEEYAFLDSGLSNITFDDGLMSIRASAFSRTPLKEVELPKSLVNMEHKVFEDCSDLQEADLSKTKLTQLPTQAFDGCRRLISVDLPETLTRIDAYAFNECQYLGIVLPKSIVRIEKDAFDSGAELWYGGTKEELINIDPIAWLGNKSIHTVMCTDGEVDIDKITDDLLKDLDED